MSGNKLITLQITTRGRLTELLHTLHVSADILKDERVETLLCIDGYEPETEREIQNQYPDIRIISHAKPRGLIACRNKMMSLTKTPYVISLDDDAHFISCNNVDNIIHYFELHPECAVLAFRIFWGKRDIENIEDDSNPLRVKCFVGCGHAWRMSHWMQVKPYPEWLIFYGEEEYAAYKLFKQNFQIHYLAKVFIHHRVDINARKTNGSDYIVRQMRSYRAGLFNIACFFPLRTLPRIYCYSLWNQFKTKTLKGDWKATIGYIVGLLSFLIHLYKLPRYSARLSEEEYTAYMKLKPVPLYWKPL